MAQLSLHLQSYNDKVKLMNQTNSKSLTLNAIEAQNLHNDIFLLLAQIAELTQSKETEDKITLDFDGGLF
jgi:hypothetical protein